MRRVQWGWGGLIGLAFVACSKKEPTPPPAEEVKAPVATTPANEPDAAAPAPDTAVAPAPAPDTAAPAPDSAAAPAPDAAAAPADTAAVVEEGAPGDAYLVWMPLEGGGYETVWLGADGDTIKIGDRRAEAVVWAGDTLWGIEHRYTPFREKSCEEYEKEDGGGGPGKLGPEKYEQWAAAKGLAGAKQGTEVPLANPVSYEIGGPDTKPPYLMIGEHWGRDVVFTGGAGATLFVVECSGSYGCGAHGESTCGFAAYDLAAGAKAKLDLEGADKALEADTKAMTDKWIAESDGEVNEVGLTSLSLLANGGDPRVAYLLVAEVSYAATGGDWGSYTQSREHIGAVVPALGLAPTPRVVKAYLAADNKQGRFGWSRVPAASVEAALAAFKDQGTLPAARPADQAPEAMEGAKAKLAEGRKLTRDKRYAEAIAAFDAALALDAKLARAVSGRGYAKLLSDDVAGARADFEAALALDADAKFQSVVHFNLGEVAEREGDKAKAIAAYEKADQLNPSDAAKKRLEKLKAL